MAAQARALWAVTTTHGLKRFLGQIMICRPLLAAAILFLFGFTVQAQSIDIGETAVLSAPDSGNANLLLAQAATLSQTAIIGSFSFYVTRAAGNLKLAIYDSTGPNGQPGNLKANTASFAAVKGWNTQPVVNTVSLPAGNY